MATTATVSRWGRLNKASMPKGTKKKSCGSKKKGRKR